jgi:hypothetical protein
MEVSALLRGKKIEEAKDLWMKSGTKIRLIQAPSHLN